MVLCIDATLGWRAAITTPAPCGQNAVPFGFVLQYFSQGLTERRAVYHIDWSIYPSRNSS
jgi:hypothetical protein